MPEVNWELTVYLTGPDIVNRGVVSHHYGFGVPAVPGNNELRNPEVWG
ncbi:MAG: hypothetical protein WAV47_22330 [Blastocatellia bacterium]